MRTPHVVLGLLVAAGVAGSLAVIPRDRELALMYLLGDDFESAQSALEARLAAGDMSPGVVAPLSKVYLEIGDFERAIELMERYAIRHPEDADTKQELAKLYRQASRLYDYVETLADLARIRPSEQTLRELSYHYGDHGEDAKQAEVLRALVQLPKTRMEDWMDLAQVEAGLDNYENATRALLELQRRFKVPKTQANVEFFVSVLARTGREGEALALARDWLATAPGPVPAMGIVRQFLGAGKEAPALELIEGLPAAVLDDPVVFSARTRIEIGLGRREAAFQRLRAAYARGALPPDFEDDLVDLALERNLTPLALEVALRGRPTRLPEWQIVSVIGIAPEDRLPEVARWALSAGEVLERRPALGAIVLKAVGQHARALAMAERALADPADLSPDQILTLVNLLADLGRADQARLHLGRLVDRHGLPEASALDIANTMIQLGQAEAGWSRVSAFRDRQRQRSPAVDAAWALISAAAGRAEDVVAWLDGVQASQLDAGILSQLGYLALDKGQARLAYAAARRLVMLRDGESARLLLANALSALGRQDEVLAQVRPLKANSPEAARLYILALADVARRGDAAALAELDAYWREQLARSDLEPETLAALVYTLLDKGLGAEAFPAIFWLAHRLPETWPSTAAEEARKIRRQAEARQFFARELERTDLSAKGREQVLFALTEVGGATEALPEILRLARADPTDQWFYTYVEAAKKASRRADLEAFLAGETRRSELPKERREARLYAFLELVGPEKALPDLKRFAEAYGGDWASAYDEALAKLGRTEERRLFLAQRAARPGATDKERREIAYVLVDLGDRDAAIAIFRGLAAQATPDDPVVGELVYLWREAGRLGAAVEWLAGRAAAAPAAQRPLWARQLLDAEVPARALAALGPDSPAEPEETAAVRIDALIQLKRLDDAGRIVAARAEGESDLGRLRKLARQGLDADSKTALAVVYGRIARLAPADAEAARWLGLQEYYGGRPGLARRRLAQVVDTPVADHEVNSAYGEILLQAGERDAARFHFRRALGQVEAAAEQTVAIRVARAQLLNRLGESRRALELMAALVEERPADNGLRADYANLLMDNKLYDQARRILGAR